jgi:gluconate 5-dehydrogenase
VNDWLGMRDRTVLVAGAGGLGGACVFALADLGAKVLAVDMDQARRPGGRADRPDDGQLGDATEAAS